MQYLSRLRALMKVRLTLDMMFSSLYPLDLFIKKMFQTSFDVVYSKIVLCSIVFTSFFFFIVFNWIIRNIFKAYTSYFKCTLNCYCQSLIGFYVSSKYDSLCVGWPFAFPAGAWVSVWGLNPCQVLSYGCSDHTTMVFCFPVLIKRAPYLGCLPVHGNNSFKARGKPETLVCCERVTK